MIYSKTCEYALRALAYLAAKKEGCRIMAGEVSRSTGVPAPYIAKIFQCLVRNGILDSRRGSSGGFAFRRPPESISLFEIVDMVDDISFLVDKCVMGLSKCSSKNACPLHSIWSRAKEDIQIILKRTSLIELGKDTGRLRFRDFVRPRLQTRLGLTRKKCLG